MGHDRDGDEVEYDDKDEEPHPQHLHNPTCAQGEGEGMCLFNGRCTSSVFYSSITKMQIKMIKLDLCEAWDYLIRVLLERGWSQYCI